MGSCEQVRGVGAYNRELEMGVCEDGWEMWRCCSCRGSMEVLYLLRR